MQKIILIIALILCLVSRSFAQSAASFKCDCDSKADTPQTLACKPPTIITLTFDSCSQRITKSSRDGLKNKERYIFRISPVNSTFYTTKTSANDITRSATFTMPTQFPTAFNSTTVVDNANLKMVYKPKNPGLVASTPFNPYFEARHQFDYDLLRFINNKTKELVEGLGANPLQTSAANVAACKALDDITIKLDTLMKQVAPVKPEDIDDWQLITSKKICSQKDFKDLVTLTLSDYLNRVKIINSVDKTADYNVDLNELALFNRNNDAIVKASDFILQSPDIIFTVAHAKPWIDSDPYLVSGDYLQVVFSVLKPKFGNKPDTVSKNKFNFYKTHYWKWLDVSSGFFYDNLASKSYYFKNFVPSAENNSRADLSVGALFHTYWVFDSGFKMGPCIGAAVSLLDAKAKYLAGGSLIFGKNNEWAFSGGYALANLPFPSNLYKSVNYTTTTTTTVTGTTPSNSTTTTTQPIGTTGAVTTYNKFQGGLFAGISYSFLKL
jgi:hypothetical protein